MIYALTLFRCQMSEVISALRTSERRVLYSIKCSYKTVFDLKCLYPKCALRFSRLLNFTITQ